MSKIKYQKLKIENKYVLFLVFVFAFLFLIFNLGQGQAAPEFMVTWKAQSYVPSTYRGKILPTRGSPINVSFELIDNGKLANLSRNTIRWYLDEKLQTSGAGIKNFVFNASALAGQSQSIKIIVVNYKGAALEKTLTIPVVQPEVVIDAPYPNLKISPGTNNFKALPFFFNVTDLSRLIFSWSVNNKTAEPTSQEPELLKLTIEGGRPGSAINLKAVVRNLLNELEFASQSINLLVK